MQHIDSGNNTEIFKLLLDHDADINSRTFNMLLDKNKLHIYKFIINEYRKVVTEHDRHNEDVTRLMLYRYIPGDLVDYAMNFIIF